MRSPSVSDDTVVVADGEADKRFDDLIWKRETERLYEASSSVLRVFVYEMPAKFTYDLLWLFRNTYKETSNLTSNGSPVHRLIEQVGILDWFSLRLGLGNHFVDSTLIEF